MTEEFVCPRCGGIYPRVVLARNWNDWARVCLCPDRRTWDPTCRAAEVGDVGTTTMREDQLDEWLAESFPASDPLPGPGHV